MMFPVRIPFLVLALFAGSVTAQAEILRDNVNLFQRANQDIAGKTADQVHRENLMKYANFVAMDVDTRRDNAYDAPKYLNPTYAQHVYDAAETNPVVSLYSYSKYDPKNQGIGFCFGRAMFVHLDLAQHGLDRDSIKKAYVMGAMKTPDGGSWGWHVTTIAQSKDARGNEQWLAIDPIAGVMEVTKWYHEMRNSYSTDKKLKLYITEPGRIGPHPTTYDHDHLADTFYNDYFNDMEKWFNKESRTTKHYDLRFKEYNPGGK